MNNAGFWAKKISRTTERDAAADRQLSAAGWRVLRFWEHEIRVNTARAAEMIAIVVRG